MFGVERQKAGVGAQPVSGGSGGLKYRADWHNRPEGVMAFS